MTDPTAKARRDFKVIATVPPGGSFVIVDGVIVITHPDMQPRFIKIGADDFVTVSEDGVISPKEWAMIRPVYAQPAKASGE